MRGASRSWARSLFFACGGAAVLAGVVGLVGSAGPALAATCGDPGLPACPLESYMRTKIAAPLTQKDMATVATGLEMR